MTLLIVMNGHDDLVVFTLPECPGGTEWNRAIDTNLAEDAEEAMISTGGYDVTGRSLLMFALKPEK